MERQISESDWKLFRQFHAIALERFCERVLVEVEQIVSGANSSAHERYLAVFKLLQGRDKELADAFHDLRRFDSLAPISNYPITGLVDQRGACSLQS